MPKGPFDDSDSPMLRRLGAELRQRGILTKDGRFRCKFCSCRWIPGEKPKHDPGCTKRKRE